MDLTWSVVWAACGFVFLAHGGDRLVAVAVELSHRLGISALATGVVVVGLATSAPEIILSVQAAIRGESDLAYANIIGSNIANVWLIAGIGGAIIPLAVCGPSLRFSAMAMVAASLAWAAVTGFGQLTPLWGGVGLAALGAYLLYLCRTARPPVPDHHTPRHTGGLRVALWLVVSTVELAIGAHFLINSATDIASAFGVGTDIIGLTAVAFGTSLPELAATVSAVMRRRTEMVLGNVIGSNLFNILGAGGAVALVGAAPLTGGLAKHGNPVMLIAALCLVGPIMIRTNIGRRTGALFLVLYGAYMLFLARDALS